MKIKLILLLTLLIPISSFAKGSVTKDLKILRVVDSDTFIISAPFIPKPLKQQIPLRLVGVDGPGIKRWANCNREQILGEKAKDYVSDLISNSKKVEIKLTSMDKYNRILGYVYLDGKSLADSLLEANLAKPYSGGKKESWCH